MILKREENWKRLQICCLDSVTDAEKKAIPYMILANQFVSTAFFEGKDKYEELYRINKAMTEWIGTNMNKLSIS